MSKARYHLEQCIPELDDLIAHDLFTKSEVSKIMKKRTNFEHCLSSRGSSTDDYLRYINYEILVMRLREKRVKRILHATKTNSLSDWSMIKRIEKIYSRGTNKFPSDLKLWSQYLNFIKLPKYSNQFSYKHIHTVYNNLLKLHPTVPDIWISSAKYEYEVHSNFKSTRILFQNGLRFNPDSFKLWYEYLNFELNFITKLINRRKVLNLINEREQNLDMLNSITAESRENEEENDDDDEDENSTGTVAPSTGNDMKDKLNELPDVDVNMLGDPSTNSALRGDIVLVIFDVAMKTLGKHYYNKHKGYYAISDDKFEKEVSKETVEHLFKESMKIQDLFDKFTDLDRPYLIDHIIKYWKNDNLWNVNLQTEMPTLYTKNIFNDITLTIRYADSKNLSTEKLQLAAKKYMAYVSKMTNEELKKSLRIQFADYIREKFLSEMDKDDKRYNILEMIIKKL